MRHSHTVTNLAVLIPNVEKTVDFYVETLGVRFRMAVSVASHREA